MANEAKNDAGRKVTTVRLARSIQRGAYASEVLLAEKGAEMHEAPLGIVVRLPKTDKPFTVPYAAISWWEN